MPSFLQIVCLNAVFWPLYIAVTAAFSLAAVPYVTLFALCRRDRRRTLRLIRMAIRHYGAAVLKCGWPLVRVKYVDHAPQDAPPFVVAANHRSASDGYLMACLPYECIQVVNVWPFRIPWLGTVAKIAQYLSVREMPFEEFLSKGSNLLSQGVCVISFPEGTRSASRAVRSFHGSAFRLAQRARVPVVPMAIAGSEEIPRRGTLVLRPGRIWVHKLPAITPGDYKDLSPFQLKTLVRQKIETHLRRVENA